MYVEQLAQRLELTPPTVSFHLKKLLNAGAVRCYKSQYYMMYSLEKEFFDARMLDIIATRSEQADVQQARDEAYRQKVLKTFFEYGKLKSIPSQRKKERMVLEKIVEAFEYDREYPEREVNLILADYYDDFCTLRRDLVAENLLTRDHGIYRRVRREK